MWVYNFTITWQKPISIIIGIHSYIKGLPSVPVQLT